MTVAKILNALAREARQLKELSNGPTVKESRIHILKYINSQIDSRYIYE